jgi:hypothetical protein
MIDQIYDREYRAGRAQLNAALIRMFSGLGRALTEAFTVLNRIEYSAPWAVKARRARSH